MAQFKIGDCPIFNSEIFVYDTTNAKWGICRKNSEILTEYLQESWRWDSNSTNNAFNSREEAEAFYKDCLQKLLNNAILLTGIDTQLCRIAFKCPKCERIHKSQMRLTPWNVRELCERSCPKFPDQGTFFLRVFDGKKKNEPLAPVTSIPIMPTYDCPECWGSGQFIGFSHITPCSTCFSVKKMV